MSCPDWELLQFVGCSPKTGPAGLMEQDCLEVLAAELDAAAGGTLGGFSWETDLFYAWEKRPGV